MKMNAKIRHTYKMPRKAILLAAGFGTRMQPLSWDLPKPMMPLFGVPLLEHALQAVASWGVEDVLINVHHAPHEILRWFHSRQQRGGPRMVFSFEPDILGTGGALRRASHFIGSEPCWLVNTDIAFVMDPMPLVKMFHARRPPAVLWLDPSRGPRTVACNVKGVIEDFAVAVPGVMGTYTYCGIQLMHPRLLTGLPPKPFCSVIDACRKVMKDGNFIYGCVSPGSYWADLGTPERYLQAHADAPVSLRQRGDGLVWQSKACLHSVLWPGAQIAMGGSLVRSIAGRGVQVQAPIEDACIVRGDVAGMPASIRQVFRVLHMDLEKALFVQLPRRGSDRNFARLMQGKRSFILIQYRSDRRPENARYDEHARFLDQMGVDVPRVRYTAADEGILVMEDVGTQSLQNLAPAQRDLWYRRTMRNVARLHAIARQGCPELEPAFDADLYAWEHDLFLLQYVIRDYPEASGMTALFRKELQAVAGLLATLPDVLVHRDLQSSNVLLYRNRAVLIDFQGMRAGPAVYDLASLLYDSYVELTNEQRMRYLGYYLKGAATQQAEQVRRMLPVAGIQRLVQALGAFGRLGANAETARFRLYIPAAKRTLEDLMVETGLCPVLLAWLRKTSVADEHGS
jgi:N-acetylmuramate 1-kinase